MRCLLSILFFTKGFLIYSQTIAVAPEILPEDIPYGKGQHMYHYVHNYFPAFIKNNKVSDIIMQEEYLDEKSKKLYYFDTLKFDTSGYRIYYSGASSKTKKKWYYQHIHSPSDGQKEKKKKITLEVKESKGLDKINYRANNIDDVAVLTDTSITYYEIKRNKLALDEHNVFDEYGNSKFLRFVRDVDTTDIIFEFDYTNKTFLSYYTLFGVKLLVSTGQLNHYNRIIKEYFYWLPYDEIAPHLEFVFPKQAVSYSIDSRGLIHLRITKRLPGDVSIHSDTKFTEALSEAYEVESIVKFKYEYYK